MESEDEEIEHFRETLLNILKDFVFLGENLIQKSRNLQTQIENSSGSLENVGLKIAITLSKLKGNAIIYLNSLLNELNSVNSNRTEHVFHDMLSRLEQSRSNTVFKQNDKYVFAQLVEKETATDICSENECEPSTSNQRQLANQECEPSTSNQRQQLAKQECEPFSNNENQNVQEQSNHVDDECKPSTSKLSEDDQNSTYRVSNVQDDIYLSLRRETTADTIKTEESWNDTLRRSPSHNGIFEKSLDLDEDIDMERSTFNNVRTLFDPKKEDDNETDDLFQEYCMSGNVIPFTSSLSESNSGKTSLSGFKKETNKELMKTDNLIVKEEKSLVEDAILCISSSDDDIYVAPTQLINKTGMKSTVNKLLSSSPMVDKITEKSVEFEIKIEKSTSEEINSQTISNNQNNTVSTEENIQIETFDSSNVLDQDSKDNSEKISDASTVRLSCNSSPENLTDNIDSPDSFGQSAQKNVTTSPDHFDVENEQDANNIKQSYECEKEAADISQPPNNIVECTKSNSDQLETETDGENNKLEEYANPYSVETEKLPSEGDDSEIKLTPESISGNEHTYPETQLLKTLSEEENDPETGVTPEEEIKSSEHLSQEEIKSMSKNQSEEESEVETQLILTPESNNVETQVIQKSLSDEGSDHEAQLTSKCLSDENDQLTSGRRSDEDNDSETQLTQKSASEGAKESETQSAPKSLDLFNEHSYSCASASDLEDSPRPTDQKRTVISESDYESDKNIETPKDLSDNEKIDNDSDNGKDITSTNEHILNEHNYSSSNSIDNDETDIENPPNKSNDVQLNLDNFSLEASSNDALESITSSNKSFEFDLNNYGQHAETHNEGNQSDEPVEKLVNDLENILSSNDIHQSGQNPENSSHPFIEKSLIVKISDCLTNHGPVKKSNEPTLVVKLVDCLNHGCVNNSKHNLKVIIPLMDFDKATLSQKNVDSIETAKDDSLEEGEAFGENVDKDVDKTQELATGEALAENVDADVDKTQELATDVVSTETNDKQDDETLIPETDMGVLENNDCETEKILGPETDAETENGDKQDELEADAETENGEKQAELEADADTENGEKQTELESDTKNEEDLLDVIMEEIISDGNKVLETKNSSSQETIPYYDLKDIKSEHSEADEAIDTVEEDRLLQEEEEEENAWPETEMKDVKRLGDLGDELLELLKDIPESPIKSFSLSQEKKIEVIDESVEEEKALLELNEDTSELSESADSDSIGDLSDLSISPIDDMEIVDNSKTETNEDLKMAHMLSCYVRLERMPLSEKIINKYKKSLEDEIDWLCNLDNLSKKKQTSSPPPFNKKHRKKRKHSSSSSSSSLSSSSDSSCDDKINSDGNRSDISTLNLEQEKRLDEILANAICNNLGDGSSKDSDDTDDSSDSNRKNKKKRKTGHESDKDKEALSKEELEKRAWRKDPLLRGKLTSSDSDSETRNRKKMKRRYEHDTEFTISSETLDSDSEAEETREKNKFKLQENLISPIKKNVPDSSDSDSDVQYVSPVKASHQSGDDEDGPSPSQKGRRNIRSIVDDQFLAKATQKAKKEELERINRLKSRHTIFETLSQSYNSQLSDNIEEVAPLVLDINEESGEPIVQVNQTINKKLKPHQRNGIKFMWDSCYESISHIKEHPGSGCILAHCMGLGKTLQVLTLIQTLFSYDETEAKHVLIVCPLSTVNNWKRELTFAFKGLSKEQQFSLFIFPNSNCQDRCNVVKTWHLRKKAVLVVGYESFELVTNEAKLDKKINSKLKALVLEALVNPGPDLVVCDEGHLIKNKKAMRSQALNKIKTKRRIVLTGTPLQNNLIEYYHMVHFVKPNLLGTLQEFKTNFVNPITNGQYEDSTQSDIKFMRSRTHVLHEILKETVQRVEDSELEIYLPNMVDHAVFVQLHQVQVDLYNQFCNNARNSTEKVGKRFFSDFHMLQYLCSHPHLLVLMEKSKNKKLKQQEIVCEDVEVGNIENWWKEKLPQDSREKIDYGPKFVVLREIIEQCETVGDKLLVFSQKIAELNLIEHFLKTVGTAQCSSWKKGVNYCRLDGTVAPEKRAIICDTFNDKNKQSIRLLLMTTQVGGLGLNLTAANRVVIMTVNWNPSYDTQSVFRVYRFGQTKQVYVYRLISLDTMEEKVYQRSVTKLAIAHRVVDKHQIDRHYKSVELQELYDCRPTADNERPTLNVPEDDMLARLILKLPCIFKFHEHKALLINRQEHKMTEQEKAAAWEEYKNKDTPKPPPPAQQQNIQNGPTFEQAFNISRYNLNQASMNRASRIDPLLDWASYYTPNPVHLTNNSSMQGGPISIDEDVPSTSTSGQTLPRPNISNGKQIPSTSNSVQAASRLSRLGSIPVGSRIPISSSTSVLPTPGQPRKGNIAVNSKAPTTSISSMPSRQGNVSVDNRLPSTSGNIIDSLYKSNATDAPWRYAHQKNMNIPLAVPTTSSNKGKVHIKEIKTNRNAGNSKNIVNGNKIKQLFKTIPFTSESPIIDLDSPTRNGNNITTLPSASGTPNVINPEGITDTVVPNPFKKKTPTPNQNVGGDASLQTNAIQPSTATDAQPLGVHFMSSTRWFNEP